MSKDKALNGLDRNMILNKTIRSSIYAAAIALITLAVFCVPAGAHSTGEDRWNGSRPDQFDQPALVWKHGTTKTAARNIIKNEIERLGYAKYVRWDGDEARSFIRRFFIKVLDVRGWVADDAIVIDRCRGRAAEEVLNRCREILQKVFPGGEVRK